MAFRALTAIKHGLADGSQLLYEVGDVLEELDEKTIEKLVELGAAEKVPVSKNRPATKVPPKAEETTGEDA